MDNYTENLEQLAYQYRDDLKRPPQSDSVERRLERIDVVLSQGQKSRDRAALGRVLEMAIRSANPGDFVDLERILNSLIETRRLGDPITAD